MGNREPVVRWSTIDFEWYLQAVKWFELEICRVIRQIGKQSCRTQILIMHDYFKALI